MFLFGITSNLRAQDTFYFTDGSSQTGTYQGMNGDRILFSEFNSDKIEKLRKKNIVLIHDPQGTFRIYEGENERLINFMNDNHDLIILPSGRYERATKISIGRGEVSYIDFQSNKTASIPVSTTLAIIYSNKQLLPLADITEVAKGIWAAEQAGINNPTNLNVAYNERMEQVTSNKETDQVSESDVVQDREVTEVSQEGESMGRGQKPNTSSVDDNTSTGTSKPIETPSVVTDDATSYDNEAPSSDAKVVNEGPKMPVNEKEFQNKALRKTQQFTNYLNRIIDKQASRFEANKAINQAITLFVNDTCYVEVSNVHTQRKTAYYIREYLYHIQELKYDRVEVEWAEISYVGDIRLGPDGNWYGTVTYLQKFRGFRDGQVVYEDKTLKRMEVILRSYEKVSEGKKELLWDVLLSNIAVEHTS